MCIANGCDVTHPDKASRFAPAPYDDFAEIIEIFHLSDGPDQVFPRFRLKGSPGNGNVTKIHRPDDLVYRDPQGLEPCPVGFEDDLTVPEPHDIDPGHLVYPFQDIRQHVRLSRQGAVLRVPGNNDLYHREKIGRREIVDERGKGSVRQDDTAEPCPGVLEEPVELIVRYTVVELDPYHAQAL